MLSTVTINFVLYTVMALLFSIMWPIVLIRECRACRKCAIRWLKHEITYSFIHIFVFSIAFGLFVSIFSADVVDGFARRGFLPWAILAAFWLIMLLVSIRDLAHRPLSPYELKDPCKAIQENEDVLRKKDLLARAELEYLSAGDGEDGIRLRNTRDDARHAFQAAKEKYSDLLKFDGGLPGAIAKGNLIVAINMSLTIVYQLFCATVVWYAVLVFATQPVNATQRANVVAVALLLSLWIPARMYANHFEREIGLVEDISDSQVLFAAIISFAIFSATLVAFVKEHGLKDDAVKLLLAATTASIGFLVVKFPDLLPRVRASIDKLSIEMFIAIGLVVFSLLAAILCP